ncbi:hypothetical protein GAYE_SCF40G5401 [Galdieria yellowstonensis]|uniref:Obg-like ATPase 1 n=1 Tax=Galdieria yellowstonensis TaxID=3028027 RepID=A0AAV9IJH0_9RHOD|nr:hypothetical protein GAYE_SCF40G5401 [Galdieria yellowstonensis]
MAPKKKEDEPQKAVLGRFSHNLKMGILGLPNVGKSTFFNTLTKLSVSAENYPFCTIDPNEARIPVPDERFDWLCEVYKPASKVPGFLDIWDIAGLVKGAHEGQGLGNAFLSHIMAVDGLFHVCRAFEQEDVVHVEGNVDPVRDLEIISEELILKDLERLEREIQEQETKISRAGHNASKEQRFELETLKKVKGFLEETRKPIRSGDWSNSEIEVLNRYLFLTAKPQVYLVNLSEKDYIRKKNKWLPKIKEWVDARTGEMIIPFSADLESKLLNLESQSGPGAVQEYLNENKTTSALPKIIKAGYQALHLIYFFTAGEDEVKCWTIRKGTLAPQAAGTIHSDFEKGFICAEVMKYDELKEYGSESALKAAGKYRQQGKNYVVEDGDIILFKFNVTSSKKK